MYKVPRVVKRKEERERRERERGRRERKRERRGGREEKRREVKIVKSVMNAM